MFYATEQLSPRQSLLPSGTLWARDAVIARTGVQRYHLSELPADVADAVVSDRSGMVDVERRESDVFDAASMSSFEAVPITLGHPDEPVSPSNWASLSVGHTANVRRDGDVLVADLLIHDQRGIAAIRDGWRGLSAGYDAAYEVGSNGKLRQRGVVANHVALLPPDQEARCGDLCRVGDSAPTTKGRTMRTRDQQPRPLEFAGSAELTPEADPRDPRTGVVGGQAAFGQPGISMVRLTAADIRRIASADAERSRRALRAINESNRARWGL